MSTQDASQYTGPGRPKGSLYERSEAAVSTVYDMWLQQDYILYVLESITSTIRSQIQLASGLEIRSANNDVTSFHVNSRQRVSALGLGRQLTQASTKISATMSRDCPAAGPLYCTVLRCLRFAPFRWCCCIGTVVGRHSLSG